MNMIPASVSETSRGRVALSAHALERMAERDITVPMVEAVLRQGSATPVPEGGERINLCGVTVVLDAGLVVTVFSRSAPMGRISPKRLARMPGQARRRWQRIYARKGSGAVELVALYGD